MNSETYTKQIISDYCVIDTETTGLSPYFDAIIEIGLLRVRDDQIVSQYSQLIDPERPLDPFITELTNITPEMLDGMPKIDEVKDVVLDFIGNDVLIGHNTSFDVRFLEAGFGISLSNLHIDTMQFSKKLWRDMEHHRLSDLAEKLGLSSAEHRALADCETTKQLYDAIKKAMSERCVTISDLWKNSHKPKLNMSDIKPTAFEIDEDSFFFGKHVCFTGTLDKMLRKDAAQIVANLGGILDNGVTRKTNFLILGSTDYNTILHGEKSSKQRKAEQLKMDGNDIEIIDEQTFYDLLTE